MAAEKTVIVLAGNDLMLQSTNQSITIDLTLGKTKGSSATKSFSKSIFTSCIEGISEYSRLVFDLFPNKSQVCIVSSRDGECVPVNTWRDEDQHLGKVLLGFQSCAGSTKRESEPDQGGQQPAGNKMQGYTQGLKFGIMCLSQLTAHQFARVQLHPQQPPANKGRLILVTALHSPKGVADLHRSFIELFAAENSALDRADKSRLPIAECDFVLFNLNTDSKINNRVYEGVKVSQVPQVPYSVHSVSPGSILKGFTQMVKSHFQLATSVVMGIPMKEDQSGGNSANYDVELYHHRDAHRDVLRAGRGVVSTSCCDNEGGVKSSLFGVQESLIKLKWSNPKQTVSLEMMSCASAFRVTPAQVTSRPTVCLINFVLSGKAVMLEQPRRSGGGKVITHMLISHKGAIFLHTTPQGRSPLEDPPSMTEGFGGRVTDYRISDFNDLMTSCKLVHHCVQRTKIPVPTPLEKAVSQIERLTRVWPIVFSDSLLYSMQQELGPLLRCISEPSISDEDYDKCKQVIVELQNRGTLGEPLSVNQIGSRSKASKREEQYHILWQELEELLCSHQTNSERHSKLLDIVQVVSNNSSSSRLPRKQHPHGSESEPMDTSGPNKSGGGAEGGAKEGRTSEPPLQSVTFVAAGAPGNLLSLCSAQARKRAAGEHAEFVGRRMYGDPMQGMQ